MMATSKTKAKIDEFESANQPTASANILREIFGGSLMRTVLAILLAFAIGLLLVIFTNKNVLASFGYFFDRPGDTFSAIGSVTRGFFGGLFRGAIYDTSQPTFAQGIRPLTETLRQAGPLIAAGLGIALSFRVGLFNIGGQGQLLMGAAFAGWASFQLHLPPVVHMLVAVVFGLFGAALWAGIVGALKAFTGAHEVILTIMMNWIALYLVTFLMRTPVLNPGATSSNPATSPPDATAQMPKILGDQYQLHFGFILALLAIVAYWWLMDRSSIGYRFRAVGYNPLAAETAGINPKKVYIWAMIASGLFVGIAAVGLALGRSGGFGPHVDAGIGFDAITVALLGQGTPIGVALAGVLFGGMEAAGPAMQRVGISPDILSVVQGLIVLFVAAPPLIRAIFRLPDKNAVVTAPGIKSEPVVIAAGESASTEEVGK